MVVRDRTRNGRIGGRILIVEDQGIVATDIESCLVDDGFEVTAIATSMKDAIREVSACRPDLVLMDIRIRGEADGIDAAEHLRREFDLPIVFLTAHDDQYTLARARSTRPMAFLIKPFKPAELTSTVEIALNRSRAEQEVRKREQSFLSAMDAIGDAVLTADSQGIVRFMNRAAEELTGWRQEAALGCKVSDIVQIVQDSGAGTPRRCALLEGEGAPGSHCTDEYQVLGRDGICHWITIKAASIAATDGDSIRVVVMHDVTRHKQSEQALRRQADLLDQSQDAIFTWDVDGAINYWNRGAQALYGFSPREALGRMVRELLPATRTADGEGAERALERDGRWSGEVSRQTQDGREIIVESLLVAVQDGSGRKTVLETDRDITGRKGTELEIQRLNQELGARVRELTTVNEELGSFNHAISHDLRAPLRHIDAYTKILFEETGVDVPGEARKYLEHIQRSAQRMGRMVDELLELSYTSRKAPVRQLTRLKPMVEDLLLELKPEVQDRDIEWRIGALPAAECDSTLTRQVFANLLANAVKFTRPRNPAVIEVGQAIVRGEHVLFVRDNGVGFNMKYAHKLFGVFERLHRREDFEGTGIGLATVQRIVHKHGGRVWAVAEVDQGATFYFTLAPQQSVEDETTAVQGEDDAKK